MVEAGHASDSNEKKELVTHVITKDDMLAKDLFIANYTQYYRLADAVRGQTTWYSTPSLAHPYQQYWAQSAKKSLQESEAEDTIVLYW